MKELRYSQGVAVGAESPAGSMVMLQGDSAGNLRVSQAVGSYPKFQDSSATPKVSPQSAASLTLTVPTGALRLHVVCDAAYKIGEGTLTGTAGNGYANIAAGTWCEIEVSTATTVTVATQNSAAGSWSFIFDIKTGS